MDWKRLGRLIARPLEYFMGGFFLVALASMALAQDPASAGVAVPGANMVLGWDFLLLVGLTLGVNWVARKALPDDVEAKWLPVVMHTWSLIGTVIVAAIFGKLPGSWHAVGPLVGQAVAQSLLSSGAFSDLKKLSAFLPNSGEKGTTIGDLK